MCPETHLDGVVAPGAALEVGSDEGHAPLVVGGRHALVVLRAALAVVELDPVGGAGPAPAALAGHDLAVGQAGHERAGAAAGVRAPAELGLRLEEGMQLVLVQRLEQQLADARALQVADVQLQGAVTLRAADRDALLAVDLLLGLALDAGRAGR